MDLAAACDGEIVNADSMQVYRGLPILSALPTPEMQKEIPHHLYAHIAPEDGYSVGRWLTDLRGVLEDLKRRGRRAIIVGGTGLYFRSILAGLVELPEIPEDVRRSLADECNQLGLEALYVRLRQRDPQWAAQIHPHDRQRILRGLEVVEATNRPLSDWQKAETAPALVQEAICLCLMPERQWLYARCDARFSAMIAEGALTEVAQFAKNHPDATAPHKTLGYHQLRAVLDDELSLDAAAEQAKTQTRRYAKRQMTWNRNQMISWNMLSETDYFNNTSKILSEISKKA